MKQQLVQVQEDEQADKSRLAAEKAALELRFNEVQVANHSLLREVQNLKVKLVSHFLKPVIRRLN